MSEVIKHECGIALIRLLKPLSFYEEKYGTSLFGLQRLHLLMQKMRNRGQDGAGLATIKLDPEPGHRYISRKRSNSPTYLKDLFDQVFTYFNELPPEKLHDADWLKENMPYTGEVLLGHLRYGTHGSNTIETVHPFLRLNNWISRNLVLAGNFNMTNVDELFDELVELGQYPKEKSDTTVVGDGKNPGRKFGLHSELRVLEKYLHKYLLGNIFRCRLFPEHREAFFIY